MRRGLALAIACVLLVACGRTSNVATARQAATAGVTQAADTALPKDAFVLPGAIDTHAGLADLRRIYGAANVREGDVPSGNGGSESGVVLFPGDPRRRAYAYFRDPIALTGLDMIGVLDRDSLWRSAQGVRVGMPLAELVALNGKPFLFYGFDGNYGGWISDWMGGRLASPADGTGLHVRIAHRVFPKDVPSAGLPYENFQVFRSDHPQLARMQVVVDEITFNLSDGKTR